MKMDSKPKEFPSTPAVPEIKPGKETPMPGIQPELPETIPIEKPDPDETPEPLVPPEEDSSDKQVRYSVNN